MEQIWHITSGHALDALGYCHNEIMKCTVSIACVLEWISPDIWMFHW